MRKTALIALLFVAALNSSVAHAGPSKKDPFGIGLAVPVNLVPFAAGLGLSGKYWMDSLHAIDGTLFGGSGWLSVSGDYLWHQYYVFSGAAAKRMPVYYGVGGAVSSWSAGTLAGTGVAVQGKLGADYLFAEPFDLYVEATPALNVTPAFGFGLGLSVGGRYYF